MKRFLLIFFITLLIPSFSIAQTWNSLPCPQAFAYDLSVCDENVIWTKGQGNPEDGFSISTDAGNTWVEKDFPTSFITNNFTLGVMSGVNATTAYVIVSQATDQSLAGLYKTTDAGDSWIRESTLFNDPASFPNQVHFWDANKGFALGDGFEIYVYNAGTWTTANLNASPGYSINSPQYFKIIGQSAYVSTNNASLLKTSDYGLNWNEINIPFSDQTNVSFDFKDDNNGVIVFNDMLNNQTYSTSNGGQNWTLIGTDTPNLYNRIKYSAAFERYISIGRSTNLGLSYSEDNGVTWINESEFDEISLGDIESSSDGTVFLGGINTIYSLVPDFSTHPDYDALVAFYTSTNGDTWTTSTNWLDPTKPLNTWHGVTIENNRVTRLNLGGNNLTGTIPLEIGDLTELTNLLLYANHITGTLPSEIGNLVNLIELDLSPNNFSGSIPPEIGNLVNLEILWLNHNGLSGSIPTTFQNLINLRELYLVGSVDATSDWASSVFSGEFPDLTALPLETLRMQDNFFEFSDIADEFATYQANIPDFIFNPQYTVDPPEEITADVGDDITLTLTDVSNLSRNTTNAFSENEYQWFKDDIAIDDANSASYTILNAQNSDSGTYHCEITNADVPGFIIKRSAITVAIGTLTISDHETSTLDIYPNPAKHWLTIKTSNSQKIKAHVYDMNGRLILTQFLEGKRNAFNIEQLEIGTYILEITWKDTIKTKKFIKQ